MAKRNSSNQDYTNNADGWDLTGGTTGRKLTVTGANITLTGSGTAVHTFPSTTSTLARTDAAQTFTGVQTFSTPIATGSVATMSATVGGGVPTPPNNTTTFLRGDGTFATPSAPSGIGWALKSYSTASAATDITVSSLNLASDGGMYMVVVKAAGTTAANYKIQFNAETAGYTWGAQTISTAGAAFSFNQNSSTSDSGVLLAGNTAVKSLSAVFYLSEVLLFDGTNTQVNIDFSGTGTGTGASNDAYEKNVGTGITENIEADITSFKVLKSTGSANWKVWVYQLKTS